MLITSEFGACWQVDRTTWYMPVAWSMLAKCLYQCLLAESGELLLSTHVLKLVFDAVCKSLVKGLSKCSIIISGVGCVQIEGDNVFHDMGVVRHLQIMQHALQSCVEVGSQTPGIILQ